MLKENHWPPYGYIANLDDAMLALVRRDPMVDFVKQDFYMEMVENEAFDNTSVATSEEGSALDKRYPTSQGRANFNLVITSASSKRTGTSQGNFVYDTDASGSNVDIYIVE